MALNTSSISINFFYFLAQIIAASFITFIKSAPDIPRHLFAISERLTLSDSFLFFE
jgi:hypothetical protein